MKSSTYIKHKGLINALKFLANNSVQVEKLITDRHKQIARYTEGAKTIN